MFYNKWFSVEEGEDHEKKRYNINGRVFLIAVIALFVAVVLIIVLFIYVRRIRRRQSRRRQAIIQQLRMGVTLPQTNTKTGFDPSLIASLPIFVYKKSDKLVECAVCLSALEEEEMARLLPNCNHAFHAKCIDMWLHSNPTCPICRTGAQPKGVDAPLDGSSDVVGQSSKVGGSGLQLSSFSNDVAEQGEIGEGIAI